MMQLWFFTINVFLRDAKQEMQRKCKGTYTSVCNHITLNNSQRKLNSILCRMIYI